MTSALVAGAGGFIGHHFVSFLKTKGYDVRGVDIKLPEFRESAADEFLLLDLRVPDACITATNGVDEVYQLAADMGGIGYISGNHARIARNNSLININMLEESKAQRVRRYFYSSSACIYPMYRQQQTDIAPLREIDAYPADPEEGYGWEKLYAEKLCEYYNEEGLATRVARFHNVYGPYGTFEGGREKAPAAICRKVALAADGDEIEVWGDGKQTRSFMYIDDCCEGIFRITQSEVAEPLNLGRDEMVSIDELVDLVAAIGEKDLKKVYNRSAPQGVRGRNSDNSQLERLLSWGPEVALEQGLRPTYEWIARQVAGVASGQLPSSAQ